MVIEEESSFFNNERNLMNIKILRKIWNNTIIKKISIFLWYFKLLLICNYKLKMKKFYCICFNIYIYKYIGIYIYINFQFCTLLFDVTYYVIKKLYRKILLFCKVQNDIFVYK